MVCLMMNRWRSGKDNKHMPTTYKKNTLAFYYCEYDRWIINQLNTTRFISRIADKSKVPFSMEQCFYVI